MAPPTTAGTPNPRPDQPANRSPATAKPDSGLSALVFAGKQTVRNGGDYGVLAGQNAALARPAT